MQPITLGKYQLLKRIAAGGMAEIFVARVTGISGFEKIVVVKRILPQLATNREFIQMFLDEARIAATLHHPNIVQMYDIGAVEGDYFISMEYLHGEDVRTLMKALRQRQEGLPLEHALSIIIGLAAGLHYAHEKVGFDGKPLGIVHRDVTPQNIFITYDGIIKIVDFGIAKAGNRLNETRFGTLKGKIPYMSPEQCRSENLDRRSDLFAIGIILYELTTGFRLYKGSSEFDIMKRIVEGTIATPSSVRPSYPKELERIVMTALAKKKEDRYQSAQDLQADLEAFAREHRLAVSAIALSSFMARVFGRKIESWREAQASGKDLAEHIAERATTEPSEPGGLVDAPMPPEGDSEVVPMPIDATPSSVGQVQRRPVPTPRRTAAVAIAVLTVVMAVAAFAWVSHRETAPADVTAASEAASTDGTIARADLAEPPPPPSPSPSSSSSSPDSAPPEILEAAGILKVSSKPNGATVFIDDQEWPEKTPTVIDGLVPGEHRLKLRLRHYIDARLPAHVRTNETTPIVVELKPEEGGDRPPAVGSLGELRIASNPSCEVLIDGKSKGYTTWIGKLPAGRYRVRLINARFGIDERVSVEVRAGETTKVKKDYPLKP